MSYIRPCHLNMSSRTRKLGLPAEPNRRRRWWTTSPIARPIRHSPPYDDALPEVRFSRTRRTCPRHNHVLQATGATTRTRLAVACRMPADPWPRTGNTMAGARGLERNGTPLPPHTAMSLHRTADVPASRFRWTKTLRNIVEISAVLIRGLCRRSGLRGSDYYGGQDRITDDNDFPV